MSHAMPTRRNVVRSAAWTVPVVATSVAVPAFAVTFRNSVVGADRRHPTNLTVENTTDIDSSGGYRDRVELSGDRTGVARGRGGGNFYVEGDGTAGAETSSTSGPWRMYTNNLPTNDSGDSRGNVAVTYNSPVTSFQLDYWNASGNGQQAVFLSDFTFDAPGC